MKLKKRNQWHHCITIGVFGILIFGFTIATVIKPSTEFSETENRILEQIPEIKVETVLNGEFEVDYEAYITDQFILRDKWIGLKTSVEKMLLKRESKDIYFGENDYLIEKHTGSFTTDIAQRNISVLAEFVKQYQTQFEEQHMSVMVVPNAVDILKDKLPPFASPYNEEDYLKKIAVSLPKDVWFDTAQILQAHHEEPLYYRTDHHWRTLAAFYVYQAWAEKQGYVPPELSDYDISPVTNCFEGTIQSKLGIKTMGDTIELFIPKKEIHYTVKKENSEKTEYSLYEYSALDTKDKYEVYFGGNQSFMNINTELNNGRKILVIKDSYANCFIPFLFREFQEIDVLDLRYSNKRIRKLIEEGGYTDVMILYNAAEFAEDISISKLTN